MFKLIVFVSGNGSNLETIIDCCNSGVLDATIDLVVSNKSDAYALVRAMNHGIDTIVQPFDKTVFSNRSVYDDYLATLINKKDYDLIILAGFMHILSNSFLNNIKSPIINLHPALPNEFPGKNSIERAFDAFKRGNITKMGMMVHYVIEELDAGEVIDTFSFDIHTNDTVATLKQKVQYYEKSLLISSIDKVLVKLKSKNKSKSKTIVMPIYKGKVRDIYDFGSNVLVMDVTDRQSAFDRYICNIPNKGEILNNISSLWFSLTNHIIPNHYLYSMGNIMVCKKCVPFKIEVVVRAYITGTTETSLWTHYSRGEREYCGIKLHNGLRKNQKLIDVIVTPTTKGDKDELITEQEIVSRGYATQDEWDYIKKKALELFRHGQYFAETKGLILVDTKYEFGKDIDNNILLIDEIHTCDSSRYWLKSTYLERFRNKQDPDSFDKDIIRRYIIDLCDPYKDKLPEIPNDLINKTEQVYTRFFEMLTGKNFEPTVDKLNAFDVYNKYINQ